MNCQVHLISFFYYYISSFFLSQLITFYSLDKIPDVSKTKVSNPKRYSLSKLRLDHAHLKQLIQTRTHMSTSLCGVIYKTLPKCLRKERGRDFYSRCSIVAATGTMSWRRCFIVKEKRLCLGYADKKCECNSFLF